MREKGFQKEMLDFADITDAEERLRIYREKHKSKLKDFTEECIFSKIYELKRGKINWKVISDYADGVINHKWKDIYSIVEDFKKNYA